MSDPHSVPDILSGSGPLDPSVDKMNVSPYFEVCTWINMTQCYVILGYSCLDYFDTDNVS